jgi:hypothetical protein
MGVLVVVLDAAFAEQVLSARAEPDDIEHGAFAQAPQEDLQRVLDLVDAAAGHAARSVDNEDHLCVDVLIVGQFQLRIQRHHDCLLRAVLLVRFHPPARPVVVGSHQISNRTRYA